MFCGAHCGIIQVFVCHGIWIKAVLGMLARFPWVRREMLRSTDGKHGGVYIKYVSLKAWRNWPALFAQHQYLELGHFCLPVSPLTNSAWRNWQASTEQATFACRQAKMFFIWIKNIFACRRAKCACQTWNVWRNWWWRNEQAKTGSWKCLMSGKQCWSVSPGLNCLLPLDKGIHYCMIVTRRNVSVLWKNVFKMLKNNICNTEFEVGQAFRELWRYISKTQWNISCFNMLEGKSTQNISPINTVKSWDLIIIKKNRDSMNDWRGKPSRDLRGISIAVLVKL